MWGQGMTGKKAKTVASTRWPAIVILFASLACTVIACLLVSRQDRKHIDRVTSLAMSAVHADLSADMHGLIQDEANLAKIWEFEDPSFNIEAGKQVPFLEGRIFELP